MFGPAAVLILKEKKSVFHLRRGSDGCVRTVPYVAARVCMRTLRLVSALLWLVGWLVGWLVLCDHYVSSRFFLLGVLCAAAAAVWRLVASGVSFSASSMIPGIAVVSAII